MKLSLFLFLTLINTQAAVYSQNEKITMSLKDVTVEQVLSKIESLSQYNFLYNDNDVQFDRIITVDAKRESVEKILKRIFRNTKIEYSVLDNQIVLKGTPEKGATITKLVADKTEEIADFVKGTVTNDENKPMSGVSVLNTNSKKSVSTDSNGNYTIEANTGDSLVFSSVGYKSKVVTVDGNTINVVLFIEVSALEQVIVGANVVATKRKADVTSTTILTAKDLEKIPGTTLNSALTGIVPGTFANNVGNDAADGNNAGNTFIRGSTDLIRNGAIKTYVDGVEVAGGSDFLGSLDKNSVEKIEIIRGANATTLYGADAGGGIILITTKTGRKGKTDINMYAGAGSTNREFFSDDAKNREVGIEVAQGFDKGAYNIGGTYRQSDGSLHPDAYLRNGSIHAGANYQVNNKLKLNFTGNYNSYVSGVRPFFDGEKNEFENSRYQKGFGSNYNLGTVIAYNPYSWWSHNATIGFNENIVNSATDPKTPITPNPPIQILENRFKRPTYRYNNTLTFGKIENILYTLTTGFEYAEIRSSDKGLVYSPPRGTRPGSSSSFDESSPDSNNKGFFGQFNLAIKDRIFITLADRVEKSSSFNGTTSNPKLGITTNFTVGPIIIKPRISYGQATTQPPVGALNPEASPLNFSGFSQTIGNPDIVPQVSKDFDAGLEFYSTDNSFRFEVAFYDKKLTNFIDVLQTPSTDPDLVYDFKYVNLGKAEGRGIEMNTNYSKNGFIFTANFTSLYTRAAEDIDLSDDLFNFTKGQHLRDFPEITYGGNIGYQFKKIFGKNDKLNLNFGITGHAKGQTEDFQFDPDTFQLSLVLVDLPTITKAHFNFDYSLTKNLKIFVNGNNIFNNYKRFSPQFLVEGATYLAGLRLNISK